MRRLEFLDSLRGIAATSVIVFHMAHIGYKAPVPDFLRSTVNFGHYGVTLFFLISAFSLCLTMRHHLGEPSPLFSFYISRVFRIFPLYYAVFVLLVIFLTVQYGPPSLPFQKVAISLLGVFNFFPDYQSGIVWASWTIGVEVPFYVLFPLLYASLTTLSSRAAAVAATLALSIVFVEIVAMMLPPEIGVPYAQNSLFSHLPTFMLGMLAYSVYEKISRLQPDAGFLLIAVAVLGMTVVITEKGALPLIYERFFVGLFFAILVLGCAIRPPAAIVNRFTQLLGKWSYSIYLLHPIVITWLTPVHARIFEAVPPVWAFFACTILAVGLTIAAASVTYKLVEKPGIALGRYLIARKRMAPAE